MCPKTAHEGAASIVIPTLNSAKTLNLCLSSIENEPSGLVREILVVDGDSNDGTQKIVLRRPAIQLIGAPGLNVSAARNLGARQAKSDIVVFVDSDCVVSAEWLEPLCNALAHDGEAAAVGGRIEELASDSGGACLTLRPLDNSRSVKAKLPFVATANAAFRRMPLLEVGGFDESLVAGEDADICYRLHLHGHKIIYEPTSLVYHVVDESPSSILQRGLRYGRGYVEVYLKHGVFPALIQRRIDLAPWLLLPYFFTLRPLSTFALHGENREAARAQFRDAVFILGLKMGILQAAVRAGRLVI